MRRLVADVSPPERTARARRGRGRSTTSCTPRSPPWACSRSAHPQRRRRGRRRARPARGRRGARRRPDVDGRVRDRAVRGHPGARRLRDAPTSTGRCSTISSPGARSSRSRCRSPTAAPTSPAPCAHAPKRDRRRLAHQRPEDVDVGRDARQPHRRARPHVGHRAQPGARRDDVPRARRLPTASTIREIDTFGIHGMSTCEVFLDDVTVDADAVLGAGRRRHAPGLRHDQPRGPQRGGRVHRRGPRRARPRASPTRASARCSASRSARSRRRSTGWSTARSRSRPRAA